MKYPWWAMQCLLCKLIIDLKTSKAVHYPLVVQPVMDDYIFKDVDNSEDSILAQNLWQEHFKMFELLEIMRQRGSKEFAEMLNR